MSSIIPHLALPLRFAGGSYVVTDQDTPAEIADCVAAIVRTTIGQRVELPEFGVPDQTFTQGGADAAAIQAAVEKWEPRAAAAAAANNQSLAEYISSIVVNVTGGA